MDDLDHRARSRLHTVREHIRLENAHDLGGAMHTFGAVADHDDEPWDEHDHGRDAVRAACRPPAAASTSRSAACTRSTHRTA